MRELAFRIFAAVLIMAALYHGAGALGYLPPSPTPVWRHLLFIPINFALAWYVLKRPEWGLPLFVILVAQQSWGHGGKLLRVWRESGQVDAISAVTVLALYIMLAFILIDRRTRKSETSV